MNDTLQDPFAESDDALITEALPPNADVCVFCVIIIGIDLPLCIVVGSRV